MPHEMEFNLSLTYSCLGQIGFMGDEMGYRSIGGIYQACLGCFFIPSTLLCILVVEQRYIELEIAQDQGEAVDVYDYLRKYVRRFSSLDQKRTPKLRIDCQQFGIFFITVVQPADLRNFWTWEKVIQLDFQFVCFFQEHLSPWVSNILRLHFLTALGRNPPNFTKL